MPTGAAVPSAASRNQAAHQTSATRFHRDSNAPRAVSVANARSFART